MGAGDAVDEVPRGPEGLRRTAGHLGHEEKGKPRKRYAESERLRCLSAYPFYHAGGIKIILNHAGGMKKIFNHAGGIEKIFYHAGA